MQCHTLRLLAEFMQRSAQPVLFGLCCAFLFPYTPFAPQIRTPRFYRLMALRLPRAACPPAAPPLFRALRGKPKTPHPCHRRSPSAVVLPRRGRISSAHAPLVWRVRRALLRCASPARTRRPRRDASARCRSCCRNRCPCRRRCRCFRSWSRFRPAPLQAGR